MSNLSSERDIPHIYIFIALSTDQNCIHLFNMFLLNITGDQALFSPPTAHLVYKSPLKIVHTHTHTEASYLTQIPLLQRKS